MKKLTTILLTVSLSSIPSLYAASGRNPVDVSNVVRVEYDDNVFATGTGSSDKTESFKITEQIELLFDTEKGPTYFGFVYSPSITYFENRPSDDTDINHLFDASLVHKVSPKTVIKMKETLRRSEEPELIEDGVQFRKNNDFLYNSINANFLTELVPNKMDLQIDGRYVMLRYDEGDVSDASDYDQFSAGLDLIRQVNPNTSAHGQLRYSVLDYDNSFRDSDSLQVGLSASHIFSPAMQGDIRFGIENRTLDDAIEQDATSPYIDGSIVFLPAKSTNLTLGAGYSLDKSAVNTFAQQERLRIYGSVTRKLAPALRLTVSGSYAMGSYDTDDATSLFDPDVDTDGDENTMQFTAGLSYEINVQNSLLATYQYTELESDVRPASDYDRNRISLGWQFNL
jgi:hypothetical protein